jgi:hypothetical protein
MKRITKVALGLGLFLGFARLNATAAVTDSLTVTITPNAFYSVVIDTANVGLNLGTVALSASTQTVRPSTVTIQSTYATTDLKLQGAITSGGTPWTFDNDATSTETDKLASWATFTSIARSSAPTMTADYFSGTTPGSSDSDMVDANNRYVGSSAGDGTTNLFENNSGFDSKDMDAMSPIPAASGTSHLWLSFRMPNVTTTNNAQNITLTLTAVAPN